MADQLTNILNNVTREEGIETAFGMFIVQNSQSEEQRLERWQRGLSNYFENLNPDFLDNVLRQYLNIASQESHDKMPLLMDLLEHCMKKGSLPARKTCEYIITSNLLQYGNKKFWIYCFKLIKKVLNLVDYKGVRDIFKGCYEKARELPQKLTADTKEQNKAFMDVVKTILDRNTCLLPGYLVVSELQKPHSTFPHWTVAGLFTDYIESFRPCAQMVSIIGLSSMRPVLKLSGCSEYLISQWKLDSNLSFGNKRVLPFDPEHLEKQKGLLRYALMQPYSRDMVCGILGLNKQYKDRSAVLEEQLVDLIIHALERSDNDGDENDRIWSLLSSHLIYFVLTNHVSFSNIVTALHSRLQGKDVRRGRDHLMWMLLQFISSSIQRHPLSTFMPVIKLYELLFSGEDMPLPVPDFSQSQCTRQMAMICIWLHLMRKAQCEQTKVNWPLPARLRSHHEFLQHLLPPNNTSFGTVNDYRVALLCNAYSTNNSESYALPMTALIEAIKACPKPGVPPGMQQCAPISIELLDSLTVHAKMNLIHCIVNQIVKLATSKSGHPLSPALLETYSRLLVYTELESLSMKGFIGQLLPQVYKAHACGIMYNLLDMFSYRMYHIQPHYRVQILSHLHSLANGQQANQTHLFLCVETAILKIISGLSSHDIQPEFSRFLADPKSLISAESEELNRTLVLALARATMATRSDGSWCLEILNCIAQQTPHGWIPTTLACFPKSMQDFYNQQVYNQVESRHQLKKAVEEESRKWASMTNENDMIAHFGAPGAPPLFLCLIFKMILETNHINPIAYKILERIGARAFTSHMRKFCDILMFEFTNSQGGQHVTKCVDTINDMMWKYNIIAIDRLILCLTLRSQEGSEAQVCSFIIQLVLLKATEFRSRVTEFVKEVKAQHWNQSEWYEKLLDYHWRFPEKFALEEQPSGYYPYFGNVCLRLLPVFDIVVHRFIEIVQVQKSLEILLDHLGCLYKFHNRPIGYLYDTLHFYYENLRECFILKKRLAYAILQHFMEDLLLPFNKYVSEPIDNTQSTHPMINWVPEIEYYIGMVRRLVNVINGTESNFSRDWRYCEFPNAVNHVSYLSCIELMSVPAPPEYVIGGLLDVVQKGHVIIPLSEIYEWINAIGLLISNLPKAHWSALLNRLFSTLLELDPWQYDDTVFRMFNFKETHFAYLNTHYSYMLAIAHSVFHHSNPGQIASIVDWIKECMPQVVRTEEQFLFICHLVGPFLQRLNTVLQTLTTTLYELIVCVDSHQNKMKYMDQICDFFYHIKYMYGDFAKTEVENLVRKLSNPLQMKLRFMVIL
ncbi:hypothetical protein ABEB36_000893 [Hypothenemus hampei]|uniref:Mediator of RNA polymerase II transcription subunit 23 n=1 Tax=Hypothenemus hampei TaxID=57062 RepID=A0ABD1FCS3_HYPHA